MEKLKNYLDKFYCYYFASQNQQMEGLISSRTNFYHYFEKFIKKKIAREVNFSFDSIANFVRYCTQLFADDQNIENLFIVFFCYKRYYASNADLSKLPEQQINDHFYGIFQYSEGNESFYVALKNDFIELIGKFPRQQPGNNAYISTFDEDTIDLLIRFVLTVIMFDAFISCFDLLDVVENDIDINSEAEYFSLSLYCGCFNDENHRARIKEYVLNSDES